jgi:hypothetical protein
MPEPASGMSSSVIVSDLPGDDAAGHQIIDGKFLQLRLNGQEHLVFASLGLHRYHNQILGHFAETQGITHRWTDGVTLELDAPGLEVLGGGRFRLDPQCLRLFGDSQVYGRFDPDGLAQRIGEAGHDWSTRRVEIC